MCFVQNSFVVCVICLSLTVQITDQATNTHSNPLKYMSSGMFRPKQNCTKLNDVFIEETGECRKQVSFGGMCRYSKQCSYVTENAICNWKSEVDEYKTCQCSLRHIPSARYASCVPKRRCKPNPPPKATGSNPVDQERGDCPEKMKCLNKEKYCICKQGFAMDDRGNCMVSGEEDIQPFAVGRPEIAKTRLPIQPKAEVCSDELKRQKEEHNRHLESEVYNSKRDLQKKFDDELKNRILIEIGVLCILVAFMLGMLAMKYFISKCDRKKHSPNYGQCSTEMTVMLDTPK